MNDPSFWGFLGIGIGTAVLHALLPNHWLPFVAAARAYRWRKSELLRFTAGAAVAHALMLVALAGVVGLVGEGVAHFLHEQATRLIGTIFVGLAVLIFFAPNLYRHRHIHHPECEHCHDAGQTLTKAGLFAALVFSPCEGLLLIFFAAAVRLGWLHAIVVAAFSSFLAAMLMVLLVLLGYRGWERSLARLHEAHERYFVSGVLLVLGLLLLFGHLH